MRNLNGYEARELGYQLKYQPSDSERAWVLYLWRMGCSFRVIAESLSFPRLQIVRVLLEAKEKRKAAA